MNLRFIWIAEVPHHENITIVTIATTIPFLMNGNTVNSLNSGMRDYHHIIKSDLYITTILECLSEIFQILFFTLCGIDNLSVAIRSHL